MRDVNVTDPNRVQDVYMVGVRKLMMDRTVVHAPLFDLPAKMIIGVLAAAHALPEVIRTLETRIAPEELGERLRVIGVHAAIGVQGLAFFYLMGRVQRYLYSGWPEREGPGDHADARYVMDFYERMIRAHRTDGKISPEDDGAAPGWPLLCDDEVADLARRARQNGPPQDRPAVKRALAQLETFIFLLHADARDGIWHHGPYELEDGGILVVKEHTDLQNPYMPWARDRGPSVSKVVTAMVLEDVTCTIDSFGGLHVDPVDYLERCVGITFMAGEELETVIAEQVVEIANETKPNGRKLYAEMMGWHAHQKVLHGATQYGSDLRALFETAGFSTEETQELLVEPFERAAEPYLERLIEGRLDPQVYVYVTSEEKPQMPIIET